MSAWGWLIVAAAVMVASWVLMVILASRLPDGVMKDLAGFLPACVVTARILRADPRVPRRAKVAVAFAALWVISPIDLIPEFLPVIGPLDDIVVVAFALRYAARLVPRHVLMDAWPRTPRPSSGCSGARASSNFILRRAEAARHVRHCSPYRRVHTEPMTRAAPPEAWTPKSPETYPR